ncbi:MAG: 5-formyltetrahydrofolate cyclo-ligase [Thermodesulfovibrionales bacterium]
MREETLRRRDSIPPPVRRVKDASIRERLRALEEFVNAGTVLLYASFRSEVDTLEIISEAISSGKRVFLPRVEGDVLGVYEVEGADELSAGFMGIPEPPALDGRRREAAQAEVIIVPGVAFDPLGWRLGYGKGYYDRLLSGAPGRPRVALAYEEQMAGALPHEEHDVGMDVIVTDRRVIRCHGQK